MLDWKRFLSRLKLSVIRPEGHVPAHNAGFRYQGGVILWSHILLPTHGPVYMVMYGGTTANKELLVSSISRSLGTDPIEVSTLGTCAHRMLWQSGYDSFAPREVPTRLGGHRVQRICTLAGLTTDDEVLVREMLLFIEECVGRLDETAATYVAIRTESIPDETRRNALRIAMGRIISAYHASSQGLS